AAEGQSQEVAYRFLYWGTFIFAIANGTLEAVANPLVATLFPNNKMHYLNILHASWPAGMVLGGMVGWFLGDGFGWHWKTQLGLFLVPTIIYGLMFLGQHMPKSEASQKGLSFGEMFQQIGILGGTVVAVVLGLFFNSMGIAGAGGLVLVVIMFLTHTHGKRGDTQIALGAWLLFVLFVTHAMVGAVELGTDGWIQNITGNILTPTQGKILFVFAAAIMFSLRFCADFIEKRLRLSPLGILFTCAVLAVVGLNMASGIETFLGALVAIAVYAVGKTFFWPTMLAVVGDRFPQTGAIAMSIMGGIGMMSAGLIGSPGLGYAKDRFASEALQETAAAVYDESKSETPSKFLVFAEVYGLDGKKLGDIQATLADARKILQNGGVDDPNESDLASLSAEERAEAEERQGRLEQLENTLVRKGVLDEGKENPDPRAALAVLTDQETAIHQASIQGDRKTLKVDSVIPLTMAVVYLLLLLYFKSTGGYKPVSIEAVEESGGEAKPADS
ncbi:MAG: MFS transporter, partial [Planctomycetes bacterium]|nr:MFS transporter [Planctomycetota bacterium]